MIFFQGKASAHRRALAHATQQHRSNGRARPASPLLSRLTGSATALVNFIVGAQGQQENGLLAFVLRVLEDDAQVVTSAASPTTRQLTAQLVCPQRRMRGISR